MISDNELKQIGKNLILIGTLTYSLSACTPTETPDSSIAVVVADGTGTVTGVIESESGFNDLNCVDTCEFSQTEPGGFFITLKAMSGEGQQFAGWTGEGAICDKSPFCTLKLISGQHLNVSAAFEQRDDSTCKAT